MWRQFTNLGPSKMAAALISQMETVARQVCVAAGNDVITNNNGVGRALAIVRDCLVPGVVNSVYQEVARFLRFKRADRSADAFLVGFDLLRRKAEFKVQMGGGFPEAYAVALCLQNAALSRRTASADLASAQGGLGFSVVAKQMRRSS